MISSASRKRLGCDTYQKHLRIRKITTEQNPQLPSSKPCSVVHVQFFASPSLRILRRFWRSANVLIMAVGINTVSIILGAFPILVATIGSYAEDLETMKKLRRPRRELTRYAQIYNPSTSTFTTQSSCSWTMSQISVWKNSDVCWKTQRHRCGNLPCSKTN